jgi:N-succinyldiaminopimelate aminotransferase
VLVTAGATEAIAAAVLALCDPGDEILAFEPTYDSYRAVAALAGAVLRPVTLVPPPLAADVEALAALVTDRTRLVLLNSPHNPTGRVFTADELAAIARLCVERDLIAVTDEVYEHLVFDGVHRPLATFPGMADRTLTISSAGKTFSFTGWKVGWVCGSEELVTAVRTAKQFLTYVNAAPFQPAMAVGLRLGDDFYRSLSDTLRAKRDLLCDGLRAAGFDVFVPEGTYFATVDIRPVGGTDGLEFCRTLPARCGVVAVPSSVFYADPATGAHLVRFAFCKREEVLAEAVERLASL